MYQMISGQENDKRFERLVKDMSQKKTQVIINNVITANRKAKVKFNTNNGA